VKVQNLASTSTEQQVDLIKKVVSKVKASQQAKEAEFTEKTTTTGNTKIISQQPSSQYMLSQGNQLTDNEQGQHLGTAVGIS
jgi:ABC-type Zn uptake system ZnuABC Zn-binding protein ZnuA